MAMTSRFGTEKTLEVWKNRGAIEPLQAVLLDFRVEFLAENPGKQRPGLCHHRNTKHQATPMYPGTLLSRRAGAFDMKLREEPIVYERDALKVAEVFGPAIPAMRAIQFKGSS
jgi:hypothetical protein